MTTPTSPPPSRWTRFIPWQFSLRGLLVMITIAGLVAWWWNLLPKGTVTERQAEMVSQGMTEEEVKGILGEPLTIYSNDSARLDLQWNYLVVAKDPNRRTFTVSFHRAKKVVKLVLWSNSSLAR